MTKCTRGRINLTYYKCRFVQADFTGGDITSDVGAVILRKLYRRLHLTSSISDRLRQAQEKTDSS